MLFRYRYVPHTIETFQVWMEHLVKDVWCREAGAYSLDLLLPQLKSLIVDLGNDDKVEKDHLDGPIKRIDALMQSLSAGQKQQVKLWYDYNNDIQALCENDPAKPPGTYDDIAAINPDLATELKAFCKSLYDDVLDLKAVWSLIGKIEDHYTAFVLENSGNKCPYCGFNGIKGKNHSRREAYDHYIPKGTYPFNSVNFRNLAPMCHECNSSYKLSRDPTRFLDPLRRPRTFTRRRAFYTYSTVAHDLQISMAVNAPDVSQLKSDDIHLEITAPGRDEEVETWKDLFGIDERYRARCCEENEGKAWLDRVLDEHLNYKLTRQEMLEAEIKCAINKPLVDSNFLKKPFLEACQAAGLIRPETSV